MSSTLVRRLPLRLPEDDKHPYRTGAWQPVDAEYDAADLELLAGEVPKDLEGVYLRNTENPVFDAFERYHPFDGDGMLHSVHFHDGKADYRNRFVMTEGLQAELEAEACLFAGILEDPRQTRWSKHEGWGARRRMKDASSTDVTLHAGLALTTFYQCGDAYQQDPVTLEARGRASWGGEFPSDWGISAHPKADPATGELLYFSYSKQAPFLRYGVVDSGRRIVHAADIELPGPRLPHDMAFTENYAIFGDFPLFWEPALLEKGIHKATFFPDLPSRFGILPRRGSSDQLRWFSAAATYVLHFSNAYEDGDEIVVEGYPQSDPAPKRQPGDTPFSMLMRYIDLHALGTRRHRWRFNLRTGETREETVDDTISEFPTIDSRRAGRRHTHTYAMTSKPGWFLFDGILKTNVETGAQQSYRAPEGVYLSESPFAPRTGASGDDDDGYLLTLATDMNTSSGECQVFDARDVSAGPVARLRLPHRIPSGTHACWASATELS